MSVDVSPDTSLTEDFSSLSLLERENKALADIERNELEVRVLALEEKRARLLQVHSRRQNREMEGATEPADTGVEESCRMMEQRRKGGYSLYSEIRSRHRSRGRSRCLRHGSSSSSCSRNSSRRRRCKWSLQKYTLGKKDVRKLNALELIDASIRWCLDIVSLSIKEDKAFLQHIDFISVHAIHDHFKDSAHVGYDCAVR